MLNENAKKWVAALRSGEYKQVRERLRGSDGFCCLGVACDLYIRDQELNWDDMVCGLVGMPRDVAYHFGLRSGSGQYERGSLTMDNDVHERTFAEIADIIESEPQGLFVESK